MEALDDSILRQLEEALNDIEILDGGDAHADHVDGDDETSRSEDDDPDSGEMELYAMMDSLVAELQNEIQQQIVHDYIPVKDDEEAERQESSSDRHQQNHEKEGDNKIYFERIEAPEFGDADYVPVYDYTDIDPRRKELLQRLLLYIADSSMKKSNGQPKEEERRLDRVYQEVPILEASTGTEQFEKVSSVSSEDSDYVPVRDYTSEAPISPGGVSRGHTTPSGKSRRRKREKETLLGELSDIPSIEEGEVEQPYTESTSGRRDGTRRGRAKKQTNKNQKKKRLENLLLDSVMHDGGFVGNQSPSRDDAIRTLANSEIWKAVCLFLVGQAAFRHGTMTVKKE